jgi:hypothetical protein
MSTTPSVVSHFWNHVVECPTELVAQLQRDRQTYEDNATLIAEAEQIREDVHWLLNNYGGTL